MHPYRTPLPPESEPDVAASDPGLRLAFGVMTFVGALSLRDGDPVVGPGLSLLIAALALTWLAVCALGAGYLALGNGRRVFERPVVSSGAAGAR